MLKKVFPAVLALSVLAVAAEASSVATLSADGTDNFTDASFWGVTFSSDDGSFLESVVIDLSADTDGFFDFDGSASFNNATTPVVASANGLAVGDITYTYLDPVGGDPTHVSSLMLTFAAGSFGDGDSLFFGADTDYAFSDPGQGQDFGLGALGFATLEGGATGSSAFATVGSTRSEASIAISPVPLPASLPFLLAALGGLGLVARRRKTS